MREGGSFECVPLRKLEELASETSCCWKFEGGWLMLMGLQ